MSEAARRPHYDLSDYLRLEETSNVRHEFVDGEILAMAGGSPAHSRLCANLIALLGAALRGRPCQVFTSDLRVRVQATGLDTYPDASVVCGPLEMDGMDAHALANPILLAEVTSPSTAAYDRGAKLQHYKRIPTLREILIASHGDPGVELWSRDEEGHWMSRTFGPGEVVAIDGLGCRLAVEEIDRDPLS